MHRQLLLETAEWLQLPNLQLLWGLKVFYETLQVDNIIHVACALAFPEDVLTLVCLLHYFGYFGFLLLQFRFKNPTSCIFRYVFRIKNKTHRYCNCKYLFMDFSGWAAAKMVGSSKPLKFGTE